MPFSARGEAHLIWRGICVTPPLDNYTSYFILVLGQYAPHVAGHVRDRPVDSYLLL